MTLTIEFTPEQEARLLAAAHEQQLEPEEFIQQWVEHLPLLPVANPTVIHSVDPENDASIALLQSWLAEDATDDPDEIREAEEDLEKFKRNMNAPRKIAGARLHFPEVE